MSKLEVDAVEPQSGTSLTLGASGDTITIPSGAIISNQGTATGFGPTGAVSWDVANIKTTGFTAVNGLGYFCNTTSTAFTVTLPATPSAGNVVAISDYAATFATNNITVNPNGNKIAGSTLNAVLSNDGIAVTLVYVDSTQGWIVTDSGDRDDTPQPYSVDFLVIAGGAGGGADGGGGGGAGGYRNSYSTEPSGGGGPSEASLTFTSGIVYTITVGAGGSAGTYPSSLSGGVGVDSSISGTGLTTITSSGGGSGGGNALSGGTGGSGGGGGQQVPTTNGGSGTANQGYAGGSQDGNNGGGGGGGASAVGQSAVSTSKAGDGGAGLASSITGSSVSRGGGGGGGYWNSSGGQGVGGTGGGGNGASDNSNTGITAGAANTGGGGGGGSGGGQNARAGGSGVVILRLPTASYSGTTTGSPTVTTSGLDTILVYNASGSITG